MSVTPEQLTAQSYTKPIPLSSLLDELTDKSLDLDAEYQRDEVWSNEKKTRLIQSILGGVTIPSVIINEKDEKKVVIDGKQRISACRDFKSNIINFYNESEPENTCKYKDLEKKYERRFNNYSINCIIYQNLSDEEERDIFQRINYGENLSIGEKIKGMKSKFIPEIIKVKDNISQYLKKFGITQKRESYNECVVALLALYNKCNEYVSKGKLCTEYLNKLTRSNNDVDMPNFNTVLTNALQSLNEIYTETYQYAKSRKYAKKTYSKFKWTDVLIYTKIIIDSEDIDDTKKMLSCVIKHLAHIDNQNKYVSQSELGEYESEAYSNYMSVFDKRSNTNVNKFFDDRIKCIEDLFKHINKSHTKAAREQIYAKCGTIGESTCKLCNNHKIYPTNFHAAHIISKKNGGCPDVSNAYPTCATCNTSMGSLDMDVYISQNNISLNI